MAEIRVNGRTVPSSLVVVDTLNNVVTLETLYDSEMKLNTEENHIEVNIFGKIELEQ